MKVMQTKRSLLVVSAVAALALGGASAAAAPGEEEGAGNNLSVPVVFAEGYGLTGMKTQPYNTYPTTTEDDGLRPHTDAEALPFTESGDPNPYLDVADAYELEGTTYYEQNGPSVWKAYAKDGIKDQMVKSLVYLGDNLTGHQWTADQKIIHLEMGLQREMTVGQLTYPMTSLYGEQMSEMFGTTGEDTIGTTAKVYSPMGRLVIQKLDKNHDPKAKIFSQAIYQGYGLDGEGRFATEVTRAGTLSYAYNWWLRDVTDVAKAGWWRISFKIDEKGTWDNGVKDVTVARNAKIVGKVVSTEVEGEDPLFKIRIPDPYTAYVDIQILK
jgi:hypothetical protein